MRQLFIGFVLGAAVNSIVWAGAGNTVFQPNARSRPDQLWDQDRGSAVREYLHQRQADIIREHTQDDLKRENQLKRPPC
jgi:hypothetical protein